MEIILNLLEKKQKSGMTSKLTKIKVFGILGKNQMNKDQKMKDIGLGI